MRTPLGLALNLWDRMTSWAETVEIVAGQLGERAEVVGALALGIRSFEPVLVRRI